MDGKALREWMNNHGWSVEELANHFKRSERTVARWLNDEHPVPPEVAMVLEQVIPQVTSKLSTHHSEATRPAQRAQELEAMTDSKHPKLSEYVDEIASNGDNGIDALAVVTYDLVRSQSEMIFLSGFSNLPRNREPDEQLDEVNLLKKVDFHAKDIVSKDGVGRVATFFMGKYEFAIIQLHDRDFELNGADIIVYINCRGDKPDLLRRNAARFNGKISKLFKMDEGLSD